MKRICKQMFGLVLAFLMVFSCVGEAMPVLAAQMTQSQFKKYKPVITKVVSVKREDQFIIRTEPIDFDIYVDLPENMRWSSVYVYGCDTKNGEYFNVTTYYKNSDTIDGVIPISEEGYEKPHFKSMRYFKVQFTWVSGVNESLVTVESKISDPYKAEPQKPDKASPEFLRISSTMLWVDANTKNLYKRQFQIREMGTSKWVNVTKSKLVKKIESYGSGYYLTVAKGKEFELRCRYYYTADGEKVYGKWGYQDTVNAYRPKQLKVVNALQFDAASKDGIALFLEDWCGYDHYYQVAYRKIGSGSAWKTYTVKEDEFELNQIKFSPNYQGYIITKRIRVGYEYKIRSVYQAGKRGVNGKYSKTFKVTKSSVKYKHAMKHQELDYWLRVEGERPIYDASLTLEENTDRILRYLKDSAHCIKGSIGARLFFGVGDLYPSTTIEYLKDRVMISMRADNLAEGALARELLLFYSGDMALTERVFNWQSAKWTFGHADPRYFGLKLVQDYGWLYDGYDSRNNEYYRTKTTNGGILEYNGVQVEYGLSRETHGNDQNVLIREFIFDLD